MKILKVILKKMFLANIMMLPLCLSAANTIDDIGVRIYPPNVPDGYSTVRLFWSFYDKTNPNANTVTIGTKKIYAKTSAVIRDGVTIISEVPWSVYIDSPVAEGTHSYQIQMKLYSKWTDATTGNEVIGEDFYVYSEPTTVTVSARNKAKVKYEIREIYNFRIGAENAAHSANNSGEAVTNMYIPCFANSTASQPVPYFDKADFVRCGFHLNADGHSKNHYWFFVDNGFGSNKSWGRPTDAAKDWARSTRDDQRIFRVKDDPKSLTDPSAYEIVYSFNTNSGKTGTTGWTNSDASTTGITQETYRGTYSNFYYFAIDRYENFFTRYGNAMYNAPQQYQVLHSSSNYAQIRTGALGIKSLYNDQTSLLKPDGISNGTWTDQAGRCDQISMRGLADSNYDGTTEVLFSPKHSNYIHRVRLDNGNFKDESYFQCEDPTLTFGGSENFAFFVDGPNNKNRYIHQTRSNSYECFELDNPDGTGNLSSEAHGTIINYLSTVGQVNNTGGSTLYFKGYSYHNDVYCNDLFISTPMGFNSVCSGSFQVNLAYRPAPDSTDDQFEFNENMAPVGVFAQREEATNVTGTNANSAMLFMTKEIATDALGNTLYHQKTNTDGSKVNDTDNPLYRIFVYEYVPLFRIAKYEIVPIFDPTQAQITIEIDKKYDNAGVNLVGFNDKMYFYKPEYDEGDYVIKGYDIILTTPDGKKYHYVAEPTTSKDSEGDYIFKCTVHEMELVDGNWVDNGKPAQKYGENGNALTDNSGNPIYYGDTYFTPTQSEGGTSITYEKDGDFVKYYELPFPVTALGRYTADISVIIGPKSTEDKIVCAPYQSYTDITMETVKPNVDAQYSVLETIDSDPNVDLPIRADVKFELQEGTHDPVSYYEIYVKTPDGVEHKITCEPYNCIFVDSEGNPILDGEGNIQLVEDTRTEFERGVWVIDNGLPTEKTSNKAPGQCPKYGSKDSEGNIYPREAVATIQGTYDFVNGPGYPLKNSDGSIEGMENTIFSIYLSDPLTEADKTGKTDEEIKNLRNSILENYEFIIKPVFAAGTAFETRTDGAATATYGGTTGIKDIAVSEISVFPVPADSEITVKAPFEISEVKFYSVLGAVVKTATFAGDSDEVNISIENLSSGFYYLSINGSRSIKFIKR